MIIPTMAVNGCSYNLALKVCRATSFHEHKHHHINNWDCSHLHNDYNNNDGGGGSSGIMVVVVATLAAVVVVTMVVR